jgi:FSR family fosmidomycin resistance protein-like MFS transporter
MRMGGHSRSLIAYAFAHFCVDFTCFYILFHGFKDSTDSLESLAIGFLAYNAIAFGFQPIIGFLFDSNSRIPVGILGCALVSAGMLALSLPWLALVLCAFGNACFHIGGGIDSLRHADGKMARSGIFVSTGALGVVFGTMAGKSAIAASWLPFLLMTGSIVLLLLFTRETGPVSPCTFDTASDLPFAIVTALALASVVIRAFAGGLIPMAWRTGAFLLLLPGIGACAGKALGGILGDRFGAKSVGVTALLLSIPFLAFGNQNVFFSVSGILLFNMTMPITLCVVASRFPRNPGLAFGLTTLALLCGTMPAYFLLLPRSVAISVLIALVLLSAIFAYLSTKNSKGERSHGKAQLQQDHHVV